jgi:uncharacterized protein YecE (DUF72 family)
MSDSTATPSLPPLAHTRVYIGAQGFSPRDWVGTFYPPGLPASEFLPFYARVLDTVELNTTFYAIPAPSTVRVWAMRVPAGFVFSAKMTRTITHDKELVDVEADVEAFLGRISALGDKLGTVVVQFPRSFNRRFEHRLRTFLPLLPRDMRFAIEFRSPSWDDPAIFDLLRQYGVAWCITHWQDLPPVIETTADFAYFRLVGFHDEFSQLDRVQHDRSRELASWARTIADLTARVNRIYVYINNHYEGHSPSSIQRLKALLGLPTIEPRSQWPQQQNPLPGMAEQRTR